MKPYFTKKKNEFFFFFLKGIIIYEFLTGKTPFYDKNEEIILQKILTAIKIK